MYDWCRPRSSKRYSRVAMCALSGAQSVMAYQVTTHKRMHALRKEAGKPSENARKTPKRMEYRVGKMG